MFIDGVFYNDTRQPDAADCSSYVQLFVNESTDYIMIFLELVFSNTTLNCL